MSEQKYYVYILTNYENTTLYIGVTNDVTRRTYQHKSKCVDGYAEKYNCYKLVYVEESNSIEGAIKREKQLKRWSRQKKENLINSVNAHWQDLYGS